MDVRSETKFKIAEDKVSRIGATKLIKEMFNIEEGNSIIKSIKLRCYTI